MKEYLVELDHFVRGKFVEQFQDGKDEPEELRCLLSVTEALVHVAPSFLDAVSFCKRFNPELGSKESRTHWWFSIIEEDSNKEYPYNRTFMGLYDRNGEPTDADTVDVWEKEEKKLRTN